MSHEFYNRYFEYIGLSESPRLYHRWTAVSIIAAQIGRRLYIPFGHDNIYPNHYILLVGDPGARKGTAITPGKRLLRKTGYRHFSPDRLSPERFIIELERASLPEVEVNGSVNDILDLENLTIGDDTSELYVNTGEFSDFIGDGNLNFIRLLTNLWDNLPEYKHPKIHGHSVAVPKPTVNIISGTNPQDISSSIPIEALSQGFFSRFIVVHGESLGRLYSRLPPVDEHVIDTMMIELKEMSTLHGEIKVSEACWELLDRVYKEFIDIDDFRFKHYCTRRYTHLLKLCIVFCAMEKRLFLTQEDIINANTLLHYTELRMPKALGEFGKAKNSDVVNDVMRIIQTAATPPDMKTIYRKVHNNINKHSELIDILNNLKTAGKIQTVPVPLEHRNGYAPLHQVAKSWPDELLNQEFLTAEERM